MTRKKRTSQMLEKAELRSAGLKAIDLTIDFGDTRTIPCQGIAFTFLND